MIVINNTSAVKNMAENVLVENKKIQSANESISYVLGELNEYWSANQEDQQAFYKGLEQSVEAIGKIVECNKEFSEAIIGYMEVTDSTSANVTM